MRLPADAIIAPEKMTRYLLVRQARGDTIWKKEYLSGVTKFITLIPET